MTKEKQRPIKSPPKKKKPVREPNDSDKKPRKEPPKKKNEIEEPPEKGRKVRFSENNNRKE